MPSKYWSRFKLKCQSLQFYVQMKNGNHFEFANVEFGSLQVKCRK